MDKKQWVVIHEFEYQGMDVRQVNVSVNLRIKKSAISERTIALLHTTENTSIVSFWGQDSFHLKHAITLN